MPDLDPALTTYADRLLVGTDHTPTTALAAAEGSTPTTGAVAAAVRDGWIAAQVGERP